MNIIEELAKRGEEHDVMEALGLLAIAYMEMCGISLGYRTVVFNAAENDTYVQKSSSLTVNSSSRAIQPPIGKTVYFTYIEALDGGKKTKDIFEAARYTQKEWEDKFYVAK